MKAIIFDFDGVLVESVDIKTDAFRELFKDYPQYVDEFAAYHEYNGGVSRFEKIKYFYRHFLKENITQLNVRNCVYGKRRTP
jgi:beta-phosphoglucomutase-like phosphatase (HAD superfamily)